MVHSIIEVAAIGLEIVVFLREIGREWSGEDVKIVGKIDSKTLE